MNYRLTMQQLNQTARRIARILAAGGIPNKQLIERFAELDDKIQAYEDESRKKDSAGD